MSLDIRSPNPNQAKVFDIADPARHGVLVKAGSEVSEVRYDDGAERNIPNVHLRPVEAPSVADRFSQLNPLPLSDIVRLGQEAMERKRRGWEDWLAIAEALQEGRTDVMRALHTNEAHGRRFEKAMGDWLIANKFKEINKATRCQLLECLKHKIEIEKWRARLTDSERWKFNHPDTVLRKWKASTVVPNPDAPPKTSPIQRIKDKLVAVIEERDRYNVPFDRIRDQRNNEPIIHRKAKVEPEAGLYRGLSIELPSADDIDPTPYAVGFTPRQAFLFVIFSEKSSPEEILLPIAQEKQADLYLGPGEMSDTFVYRIARDADEDGRPLVVFTLTDCDPSRWQMPVSIARKLQALKDLLFPTLEFEMVPIALTPDQVRQYGLPEEPVKQGDQRAKAWKREFGVDQTEIDSLTTPEMQRRDLLREIVEVAFDPYFDHTLEERVAEAEEVWLEEARSAINTQVDQDRLAALRAEAAERFAAMRAEIDRIDAEIEAATAEVTLPSVEVPESEIDLDLLDPGRQALVSFDGDWMTATRALIKRKSYSKNHGNGDDT
jgi:hypothetical protein